MLASSGNISPETTSGIVFWCSFAVFAFCCNHLTKNRKYYEDYDE
jgi:hypothetical protein